MERQFAQRLDILNISFAAASKFMDDPLVWSRKRFEGN
jgi:hypothetical protein